MSKPYILEALIAAPNSYSANRECRRSSTLTNALINRYAWMDQREGILKNVQLGATHYAYGMIQMRLLVHVSVPLSEVDVESDGETFAYRIPDGEIFETDDDEVLYVTKSCAYAVAGSFAFRVFRGQDGLEIPHLRSHLLPLIRAELESRVRRIMQTDDLPDDAVQFLDLYMASEKVSTLLRLDVTDIADAAEVIAEKLRTGLITEDLYQPSD